MSNIKPLRTGRRRRGRGQAMVEFALVLPVFMLVLSGMLDFGFLLYSRMTVINASREGARAAVTASDPTTIPSVAQGAATGVSSGLAAGITVTAKCIAIVSSPSCNWSTKVSSQAGDGASITVAYTYHTFFPLAFGATIPLSSTTQMVRE